MDEQASQASASTTADSAQEPVGNQPSASPQTGTPEDSREGDTKKAEADSESGPVLDNQKVASDWQEQLKRFHNDINEVLASKENLKLKTLSIKTRPEFFREWTAESNRYMILMVNLKRRLHANSQADQKTGDAA